MEYFIYLFEGNLKIMLITTTILHSRIFKAIVICLFLGFWLYWDLHQADARMEEKYRSFKMLEELDAISSATTKVSIVRSNDTQLPDPISVSDENIKYEQIEGKFTKNWYPACH